MRINPISNCVFKGTLLTSQGEIDTKEIKSITLANDGYTEIKKDGWHRPICIPDTIETTPAGNFMNVIQCYIAACQNPDVKIQIPGDYVN